MGEAPTELLEADFAMGLKGRGIPDGFLTKAGGTPPAAVPAIVIGAFLLANAELVDGVEASWCCPGAESRKGGREPAATEPLPLPLPLLSLPLLPLMLMIVVGEGDLSFACAAGPTPARPLMDKPASTAGAMLLLADPGRRAEVCGSSSLDRTAGPARGFLPLAAPAASLPFIAMASFGPAVMRWTSAARI